jgi:hypothetical protein
MMTVLMLLRCFCAAGVLTGMSCAHAQTTDQTRVALSTPDQAAQNQAVLIQSGQVSPSPDPIVQNDRQQLHAVGQQDVQHQAIQQATQQQTQPPEPQQLLDQANTQISTDQANTWLDQRHLMIHNYLHDQALKLDQMFGNTALKKPRAQVRLLVDHAWDKHNGLDTSIRLRGSLRLPNATKRLRLMFGDDTLEEEQSVGVPLNQVTKANGTPVGQAKTTPNLHDINDQALKDNASIALRWLGSMRHGIRADYDLGVRSGTDIYIRTEAGKTWELDAESRALLDQTIRYGMNSRLYARTDLELQYRPQTIDPLFYHAALEYTQDDSERGWRWTHRISQQHAFAQQQVLSYGISVAGWMRGPELQLDSYGPWISYRQPFLRDWLFVRGDVNFFNDRPEHRDHYLSGFLRVEALF